MIFAMTRGISTSMTTSPIMTMGVRIAYFLYSPTQESSFLIKFGSSLLRLLHHPVEKCLHGKEIVRGQFLSDMLRHVLGDPIQVICQGV